MASAYVKQLQQIVADYKKAGGAWPARKIEIAEWAITHGKWELPREGKLRVCSHDLGDALREAHLTDNAGRRVRTMLPATTTREDGEQGTFWDDIRTATPEFMRVAVTQRRNGIVAECCQLSNAVRFYNSLHPEMPPIQLVLNFTNDVLEQDQPKLVRRRRFISSSATAPKRQHEQLRPVARRSTSRFGPSRRPSRPSGHVVLLRDSSPSDPKVGESVPLDPSPQA